MLCGGVNVDTSHKLELHANDKKRVSLQRQDAYRVSCLPDVELHVSVALQKRNRNDPLTSIWIKFHFPRYGKR